MPAIKQNLIGYGTIVWLGKNYEADKFSISATSINLAYDGIVGDKYRQIVRRISAHDVDYTTTDGVERGTEVLNHRQIIIVDELEIGHASWICSDDGNPAFIKPGWLRENIIVRYTAFEDGPGQSFSKLPPTSRMVIGESDRNVLWLMEENGPCKTIIKPIAAELGIKSADYAEKIRSALEGRRGQMAMVRSFSTQKISVGDTFKIFPPL